jgi:hypothetical protein
MRLDPDFLYAYRFDGSMKVGEFTKLHRKSGGMGHRSFVRGKEAPGWALLSHSSQQKA